MKCQECNYCIHKRTLTLDCECGDSTHRAHVYLEEDDMDSQGRVWLSAHYYKSSGWLKRILTGLKFIIFGSPISYMEIILCKGQVKELVDHLLKKNPEKE